ncbi:MAG: hypothetical protein GW762_04480 [Candidatus Pacebacteria bacterium]|nr:hypothetical protein [Candidatus Paceibacterota bacterium]PIR64006.1 MAG: hypothetical protein COU64_01125 [Candidatus Pacebacteria bacterium CG10_big_fil_rev_8_21_14_0_10_40_26]PIZ79626.1 MAG: hypothetical protein COY01_00700 [Candidatus Pacebacteria bacterium CG_4_10_14_0_2_um_filter_40_20]PJA69079.1 MAG: hypothetical protein CO156_01950 [Candidatus Pacebacteria bacterium CG_4_9_14_3_um_filter_40_12]PJC41787.1 MAG: hypothetical protein CO041_03655 [Candidatus Pacebacteria bacterium CG_4_9_
MLTAIVSLSALLVIVILSCVFPKLNPGLLALAAALGIGVYMAQLSTKVILAGFPSELFILLVTMSMVFGIAQKNGSLDVVTHHAVNIIRGQALLLPLLVFVLSFVISALGPGNIAAVALLAPMTMNLAKKHKISPLVIAIMLCTGANAGAFSPFSPTGVVALGLLERIQLDTNLIWTVFGASAVLQSLSALGAYGIFIIRSKKRGFVAVSTEVSKIHPVLETKQKITLLAIVALIIGVIFFKVSLVIMSVATAATMFILGLADEEDVMGTVPWSTIQMVTGISVLIGLMEKTGGLDLATTFIAQVTSPDIINALLAFVSGVVSAFSSSSGVVLPAFIPLIPGLATKMSITGIVPMVIAVAVGSHMVDVSPLSTLGALSIAAVEDKKQQKRMFNLLLSWGMGMSVVAGIVAFVFLDLWF